MSNPRILGLWRLFRFELLLTAGICMFLSFLLIRLVW